MDSCIFSKPYREPVFIKTPAMTQLIITLIILFAALAGAIYLIIKRFRKKDKKDEICSNCSSDCGECGFYKDLESKMKL
jgi:hypothetical protein